MDDHAYILDTETTDRDDPQPIEVAYLCLADGSTWCQRYRPTKPIQFGAMAIHNIIDEDLVGCAPVGSYKLPVDCSYLIGHNIEFDWKAIGSPPNIKLIDTLRLSRVVWEDGDSHTQLACLYRIDRYLAQQLAGGAHGALADVNMNRLLFKHLCQVIGTEDLEVLFELSEKAKIPATITFGKHSGAKFSDIPADYKQWYARQVDPDPNILAAMRGAEALTLEKAMIIAQQGVCSEIKPR